MSPPPRVAVIGCAISACDVATALDVLDESLRARTGGYVCFTNVHTAVMARKDPAFLNIGNRALLSLADGKPIYWLARTRIRGSATVGHVPGPDFLVHALRRFPQHRHFFYGASPAVLALLVSELQRLVPGLNICGSLSPPFRVLTEAEKKHYQGVLLEAAPDFVWVGLGAPKQEQWMAAAWQSLRPCILLGVGAAFDFHAGTVRRAPEVMRRLGLEWSYRLFKEPRRLWKRYMITNSLFLAYVTREWVARRFRRPATPGSGS